MDDQTREPSTGLRVMAGAVIVFVLALLVALPMTLGGWDWWMILIAVVGVLAVGVWAFFGIRAARRRDAQRPDGDDDPTGDGE